MNITRRGFICMAGIGMLGLAGCSQGNQDKSDGQSSGKQSLGDKKQAEKKPEPLPLEIVDSGWSVLGEGWVYYGIAIKNPNSGLEAQYPGFTITGKADDGSIIFSNEQVCTVVFPGETIYHGFQAGNGTAPASVEFKVKEPTWVESAGIDGEVFTVSNTAEVLGEYGNTSFTGEVTVNTKVDKNTMGQIALTVITRDENNAINFGNGTFIDIASEGETVPFDIPCYQVPEHSSFEIYAKAW